MKILILANYDLGLYNFRKELIDELIHNNHQVIISLPYGPRVDDLVQRGCIYREIEIDRRSLNVVKDFKLLLEIIRLIRNEAPDYVLTYTIKPNIYGGIASMMCKVRYISTITGLGYTFQKKVLKAIISKLYRYALKKAQAVLFENDSNRSLFLESNIIPEDKAVLVKGAGVNLEGFGYCPLPSGLPIRFLFIGRIMKEKGIDEFFSVAEQVKKEKGDQVEFDVLGFFEEDYKQRVETLSQSGVINFYGFQKDVREYIKKAHCVILPSYHEGMSNTLLESAAMGRPLIASDIPGCREAIIDNESGYLCRVKDRDDLYNKVIKFIMLSDDERNEMSLRSRSHIELNFDRKAVVNKIMNIMSR